MACIVPVIFGIDSNSGARLALVLICYAGFYGSTWEEYHTGTLYLGYISGPVEGAWSIVLASLVSAVYGNDFWARTRFTFEIGGFNVQYSLLALILIFSFTSGAAGLLVKYPDAQCVFLLPFLLASCMCKAPRNCHHLLPTRIITCTISYRI